MNYLSAFHLEQEPFSTNPDPEFFYKSAGHISALNHLEIAIRLKRGLSLILGDVGTGKTTLCRTLLQTFEEEGDDFIFHMILDPTFKSENLFYTHLTKIFGISPFFRSTVDHRDAIEKYLFKKCVDENKTVILVIDEGQKLKKEHLEILRTLLNYETNDRKLLQLIIFAQLELMPRLEPIKNFVDRIMLKYMLKPFDEYETGQMIEFRLRKAGYAAPTSLFSSDSIKKIFEYTKGYPRQIARICHNALELLIMEEGRTITADIIEKVIRQDKDWNC
ncbi:MAG: AAA family ATPase [Candidatus Omnitrophica bacterium]|nr:AAA family ATPase [Candidatus Omnitrophota bacterium]